MITIEFPNALWAPADPATLGVTGVEAVALRTGLAGRYAPIITVSRYVVDGVDDLQRLADEAATRFAVQVSGATRLRRVATAEGAAAPGVSQMFSGTATLPDGPLALRRFDALVGSPQADGSLAVLGLTMTCAEDQVDAIAPEFGAVLKGIGAE